MGLACCRAIEDQDAVLDGIEWKDERVPQDLKSVPLGQCHVASSHHPYIGPLQIGGRCEYEELLRVLSKGARCLALDVMHETPGGRLIICHYGYGAHGTTWLDFQKALKLISEYGWKHSDYPLFLNMQYNDDSEKETREMVSSIFGKRYLEDKITSETKIGDLVGRICFVSPLSYGHTQLPSDLSLQCSRGLVLVYPESVVCSVNYDTLSCFAAGVQFPMVNYGAVGKDLSTYLGFMFRPIIKVGEKLRV